MKYLIMHLIKIYKSSIIEIGKVQTFITHKTRDIGNQLTVFGIVMFINFPLFYLIWKIAAPTHYENLFLRLFSSFLCVPLIFRKYWPVKLRTLVPLYWYITACYCLPFFFTFMTLKNGAATLWLMNTVSVVFFMLLLFDLFSFFILLVIGTSFGFLLFHATTQQFIYAPGSISLFGIIITFIAAIIIGGIFSHNRGLLENERLLTIKAIGASIAHELRTPLRSISSASSGIKDYFPKVLEGYQLAKKEKLPVPYINPIHYKALLTACDDVESETREAFTVIDMLLMNVTQSVNTQDFKTCSSYQCIEEALRRYPFDKDEIKLVHWEKKDNFLFKGNDLIIIHVLFNLLKNALYQIKATDKGEIWIWTAHNSKYNTLHFKDTAKGIPPKQLPYIFDRFYTRTYHGTGIGLAFCKIVMENLNGKIKCNSIEGEYAEFVLYFPKDNNAPQLFDSQESKKYGIDS